jgi:hypothetical protein
MRGPKDVDGTEEMPTPPPGDPGNYVLIEKTQGYGTEGCPAGYPINGIDTST